MLPVTYIQQLYLCHPYLGRPQDLFYFFFDLPGSTDETRLIQSCERLVQTFDALRTVFVETNGAYSQYVIDTVPDLVDVHRAQHGSISAATHELVHSDLKKDLQLRKPFLRFLIIHGEGSLRLIMRISHAQTDGIAWFHIVSALGQIYNGGSPCGSSFTSYLKHRDAVEKEGLAFWKETLAGSSMSKLDPISDPSTPGPDSDGSWTWESKTTLVMNPDGLLRDFTVATIFTAACAMMLSEITKSDDVLFGRVVSGRLGLPSEHEDTVGPCLNFSPVRVRHVLDEDTEALLERIDEQHLDAIPFESVDIAQIVEHCVEWPTSVRDFWCVTQFDNIGEEPYLEIEGGCHQMQLFIPDHGHVPKHPVSVYGTKEGDRAVQISLTAHKTACNRESFDMMWEKLCDAAHLLFSHEP